MKLLFLAPQPFFEERGTPIAVKLALEVIAGRDDLEVDLLTYHVGKDVDIPKLRIHRIPKIPGISHVPPGISFRKLVCDVVFLVCALRLAWRNKGEDRYHLVHAVEESAFIALFMKHLFSLPYVYDMDSSLALQLTEKWWLLRPFTSLFSFLEKIAIRSSVAVVPVCDALAEIAERKGSPQTHILRDISLLDYKNESADSEGSPEEEPVGIREELSLNPDTLIALYVGNLESYQGIDLLIEATKSVSAKLADQKVVIIGGSDGDIEKYQGIVASLDLEETVIFLGRRPVDQLGFYLKDADILLSPRIKGNNTPMKIYSYLHSGKPLVATNLPTHTQVLRADISLLPEPNANDFGRELLRLFQDAALREALGTAAYNEAIANYTYDVFSQRLTELYDSLDLQMQPAYARGA